MKDTHKSVHQHMVRIGNCVECCKGFIASTPHVSYAGHAEQAAKQLLQQHQLFCFSHATQSVSQQQR